jgi:hypothetical protein
MHPEEIMLALIQSELDVSSRMVNDTGRGAIVVGFMRGLERVHQELDRRYGFAGDPVLEDRLRLDFPLNGDLPLRLLRRLEVPRQLGTRGETVADVVRPAGLPTLPSV